MSEAYPEACPTCNIRPGNVQKTLHKARNVGKNACWCCGSPTVVLFVRDTMLIPVLFT